jgi:hypothetical protein
MSLKAFHIFFIALSILTAFGFASWLIYGYGEGENVGQLVAAALSILAGAGLILYGIRFLHKLKHVSYL